MAKKSLGNWIWRLAAAAVVFVAAIIFLIDPAIKSAIEHFGSKAVGARVDVSDVDTHLMPLGITVTGIDVTDPRNPMRNVISVEMIRARIEAGPLLRKKLIVDTMDLNNLRFDTPRKASGALPGAPPPAAAPVGPRHCDPMALPTLAAPDMEKLLTDEDLLSVAAIQSLQIDMTKARTEWDQRLKSLPDRKKFDGYRKRLEALQKSSGLAGLLSAAAEVQSIRKEIDADIDQIESARKEFTTEFNALNNRVQAARTLPQKDIERLTDKYAPTSENIRRMGRALLGQAFCGWLRTAETWYRRLAAVVGRETGRSNTEKTPAAGTTPQARPIPGEPDILVRRANAAIVLSAGTVTGSFRNITNQPQVLGQPTAVLITAKALTGIERLQLAATLDHTRADTWRDDMTGSIVGLAVGRTPLTRAGGAGVAIDSARLTTRFNGLIENGLINASVDATLSRLRFAVDAKDRRDPLVNAVDNALARVTTATITGAISGKMTGYTLDIKTDLDTVLTRALSGTIQQFTGKFQQQLQAGIVKQTQGPLANLTKDINAMAGIDKAFGDRLQLGRSVLDRTSK